MEHPVDSAFLGLKIFCHNGVWGRWCLFFKSTDRWAWKDHNYRVFHSKWTEKGGCGEHTLALLRAQRASMWPQDWAQITFRSEMHLNDFNNESGSWLGKERNQDLVIWAQYTGCPKMESCFIQPLHTPCDYNLWPSGLLERRNLMWMQGC